MRHLYVLVNLHDALKDGAGEDGTLALDGEAVVHREQKRPVEGAWHFGHLLHELFHQILHADRQRNILRRLHADGTSRARSHRHHVTPCELGAVECQCESLLHLLYLFVPGCLRKHVYLVQHHKHVLGENLSHDQTLRGLCLNSLSHIHHKHHQVDDLRPSDDGANQRGVAGAVHQGELDVIMLQRLFQIVRRRHREPGKSQIQCDAALRALRMLVQRRGRQQRAECPGEAGFPTVDVPQDAHIHIER
mmetsp:Transcript_4307/g.8853  ORF Transcript_4307/g.8853 Transcript_4307/m.8853 type:complete len:248 (-) Transcript_4307:58-801(-)